jgi:hypothetical protein
MPAPHSETTDAPDLQLTERDLKPVKDLIDEVRRHELTEQLSFAAVTWLNAFMQFKKARNRYGLPSTKSSKYFYGVVLADLKATGKALLYCLEERVFDFSKGPISRENFEACVRELECDDAILEMGLLDDDADLSRVATALGSV